MTTLHVEDFGPLGRSDDSATINAALGAAYLLADPAMTEVVMPAGVWFIKAPLLLGSYTHFLATGARFAWAAYSPTSMLRCRNSGPVNGYEGEHDFMLTGGIFDGNRFAIGDGTNLISIVHARTFTLRQFHCTEAYDHHLLEVNACQNFAVEDFLLSNSSSGTEALQIDGMFNSSVYSEFGAYDGTPCDNYVIQRGVIWGCRDGIGSHTVSGPNPHTRGTLRDLQIVCTGIALKLWNWDIISLQGTLDLDANTPIQWNGGRTFYAGCYTPSVSPALPGALPPLPPVPSDEPDPDPDPLPPPSGGAEPMHIDLYPFDTSWPNMPAAVTEPSPTRRVLAPTTASGLTQVRTELYVKTAGAAAAEVGLQMSVDHGVTWTTAAWASLAATGNSESPWVALPAGSDTADVLVGYVGRNGNGVADPAFARIAVQMR